MWIASCHDPNRRGSAHPKGSYFWVLVTEENREVLRGAADVPREYISRTLPELASPGSDRRVTILIHGYGHADLGVLYGLYSRRLAGLTAAWQAGTGHEHAVVGFAWPSAGTLNDFTADIPRARWSARPLFTLIRDLRRAKYTVNVLAHSLGNYVTAHMLDRANAKGTGPRLLRRWLMQAPCVPQTAFAPSGLFFDDQRLVGLTHVQWSPHDGVLAIPSRVNRIGLFDFDDAFGMPTGDLLGRTGLPSGAPTSMSDLDVSKATSTTVGHSDYDAAAIMRFAADFLG